MQQIVALSRVAVVVRHWFEINLDDASMELAAGIVTLARQFSPDRCGSAAECFQLTRDAIQSVRLMISYLRRPDLLDADWVRPWTEA